MKSSRGRFDRSLAGFTLVEMVVTLTVFVLLAGLVFGIITETLQSSTTLQQNQNREDEIMALRAFLKKKLGELPASSALVSYCRNGEGLDLSGIIFGPNYFLQAIDAKRQNNGLYTLRIASFQTSGQNANAVSAFQQMLLNDDNSLSWTPLLRDIQHVDWQFQARDNPQWVGLWDNTATEPNLVEFSLLEPGFKQPEVMDLWIPPITAVMIPGGLAVPASGGSAPPQT